MTSVIVVDYGIVNLKNILRGLEYLGVEAKSSIDPDCVSKASHVILPGVGAFASGMSELRALGMVEALDIVASAGRPILGICLGMQMLLESSVEYGQHKGLGLIPGAVLPIPPGEDSQIKRKIPHVGWNDLRFPPYLNSWKNSCLQDTAPGSFCYFVHSFMAVTDNSGHVLAQCVYEGLVINAAIQKDNITGLQFHPERSGRLGLNILHEFTIS